MHSLQFWNCHYGKLFALAFCEEDVEETSHGRYTWPRTSAEDVVTMECQYGGLRLGSGSALASRVCSASGQWNQSDYRECNSLTEFLLANISAVSLFLNMFLNMRACSFSVVLKEFIAPSLFV